MKVLISLSNKLMQRYLPDPFLFVIILTFFVAGLSLVLTDSTPTQVVEYWGGGFWGLLAFTMQMVLILVTGHTLASSPFFNKILSGLAGIPKSPGQAIILVSVISLIACWINWGFGLVIGALFAKELAKKVEGVDYRLLIASAYSGFLLWHGGLSGSIPLTIATPDHFTEDIIGIVPTSETIFSVYNLVIVVALFVIIPFVNRLMLPPKDETIVIDRSLLEQRDSFQAASIETSSVTPADRLENSRILSLLTGLLGLAFLFFYIKNNGLNINLDIVNFTFLFLGILFHKTPKKFLTAVGNAVKSSSGIIIQFPFYAGLMGIMVSSGLANVLSEAFVSISTENTFHMLVFWSAGLVNFFVPSGGGQWAVQAPVMLEAAQGMGVSMSKTGMAVAWGDVWTNMIQPFWALPALAIAGLKAKDIMGFCLIVFFVSGVIISLVFLFL
ncbi:short-chain fatty acids transporter [Oikeobacillus pervagus]|uniref:Short-chain fatty acids transporter n=1 Tax=Oikeobacillus pervagus TaxID=1325931 RepID=A0AAJ1T1S7_9BACI|nr:short-chain fatty acid transporter [Oikeobacillus pervagus]MDQ0215607.1 short-chain fatty acids transporter [Oikeobacillus pervagus]